MDKTQALGIDLGTSNCAMALAHQQHLQLLDIPQISGVNRISEEPLFASALYIPHQEQFPPDSMRLPWTTQGDERYVLGNYARDIGAQIPERLISSAKSWLANQGTSATAVKLPWNGQISEPKLTPVEATQAYLHHLRQAFEQQQSSHPDRAPLQQTLVVLTVPASFDEAARTLTQHAAIQAGWGEDVVLLEEPQAAFYAWLSTTEEQWRSQINAGDIILICDVGGGTTDFSLIAVTEQEGNLALERISVGRHILLGGDNMDLALAYALRQKLEDEGKPVDEKQLLSLIHNARIAKEQLLSDDTLQSVAVAIPSRGSSLFGGSLSTRLERELLEAIVVEGFFALTPLEDLPQEQRRGGLAELGLNYASEPVISKHLAEFLTRSRTNVASSDTLRELVTARNSSRLDGPALLPDAILFNGGVFKAPKLRERVLGLLGSWAPAQTVRELTGTNFDVAVARGAAYYGQHKLSGSGVRIRAGVSRSYYIGLETTMPAIPGYKPPVKAVCVVEQGMEEGQERVLENKEFGLLTGATVSFRFFSSAERAGDQLGTIVTNAQATLEETTSLEMSIAALGDQGTQTTVPVKLHTRLNELGVVQLWMQHTESQERWELSFSVRTK